MLGHSMTSWHLNIWKVKIWLPQENNHFEDLNHFEKLQTILYEVELLVNNAPLIYVYPNTVKTCLTSNYLLFARELLLSFNTTSTVAANLTVLSSTFDKINRISNHFWDRWRYEYVVNLREAQRISKLNIKIEKGTQTLLENCH